MVDSNVKKYLSDGISAGYPVEQLKANLIGNGFTENVVDEALADVNSSGVSLSNPLHVPDSNSRVGQTGIKRRHSALVILLCFITFGIYPLYWIISTTLELRRNTKSAPNLWLLFTPLILMVLFFIAFFTYVSIVGAENIARMDSIAGPIIFIGMFFLIFLASFVCGIIFYWKYSKAIEELTEFSGVLLFFLWIFIPFVAIILAQIELNKKS